MQIKKFWTYENKTVVVLFFVFGFVFVDRLALTFLAPFVTKDLGISNAELGLVFTVFAITWSLSGYFGGYISDKKSSKKAVLLISVIAFSICSFSTGLVMSLGMLLIIRGIMGLFEGPVLPIAQTILRMASTESRRAFNMALVQSTGPCLLASLLGPIVLVAIAIAVGWRTTFYFTIIPGIILAYIIWKVIKEPTIPEAERSSLTAGPDEKVSLFGTLKYKNIKLLSIIVPCVVGAYISFINFGPLYLTEVVQYSPSTMSIVMGVNGLSGLLTGFAIAALSDKFGRKPVAYFTLVIGIIAAIGIAYLSPNVVILCIFIFLLSVASGIMCVFMSVIPSESVPPKVVASGIGLVTGIGELIGGVVGGIVVGLLSDRFGLISIFWVIVICYAITLYLTVFVQETAPVKVRKNNQTAAPL
ncbi:MAG: MFS transporter [Peptococcaceae bacterium]|nr:MFS transporter [Peptococcaceae bacterium]